MNGDLNMLPNLAVDLKQQIIEAIECGRGRFLFWGLNSVCLELLNLLQTSGLLIPYVAGIVDPDARKQKGEVFGHKVLSPSHLSDLDFDALVVTCDRDKETALRDFAKADERTPEIIISGTAHMDFQDADFEALLSSCLVKSYANGYPNTLIHLYQAIQYLSARDLHGDVAEFGIFKGGTIVFIAKALAHFGFNSDIYGFDIFEGFPQPRSVLDMYSNPKCEFKDYKAVEKYCNANGIQIVKGDICDTHERLKDMTLMLSFFDTDNYSPTKAAIETCFERTIPGGILAFDHYTSDSRFLYTLGERMAATEALSSKNVFHLHGTGIFIKI